MPRLENTIITSDMAKVRELDFALKFEENIKSLEKMLGITRKIPAVAGTVLKQLKVTGTLESGVVAEGDIIPLSHYQTTWETVGELILNKWRKATTAEAIQKGGYDQAVNETNAKALLDVQKTIRSAFLTTLAAGTGTASGTGLQEALANAWGQLQVKFEDDAIQAVYFVNPLDIATYLGKATVTTQTAFGMSYIENFLGLGNVIVTPQVAQGTFYATASENIINYYVDVTGQNGIAETFEFTTDKTGLVGIHEIGNYERMQEETFLVSGVTLFPEKPDGIIVGTINSNF